MAIDLVTIIAIMATVGVGNPLSPDPGFSIGGTSSAAFNLLGNLGGLLGKALERIYSSPGRGEHSDSAPRRHPARARREPQLD